MKIVISESQYKRLIESKEEQKVLYIPSLKFFGDNWYILQEYLKEVGDPPYSISGDLDLEEKPVKSLGNLQSVGGDLYLRGTTIKSLGNLQSVDGYLYLEETPIKSLGNLQSVGDYLELRGTPIKSLGNLTSVGGSLNLVGTPLSDMYTEEQILQMVNVGAGIYL